MYCFHLRFIINGSPHCGSHCNVSPYIHIILGTERGQVPYGDYSPLYLDNKGYVAILL